MRTTKIMQETVVFFAEAARQIPGKPRFTTVRDWANKGMRGAGGIRHTIEWCRLTKGPAISLEAYHRFIKRVNGELPPLAEDVELDRGRKAQS